MDFGQPIPNSDDGKGANGHGETEDNPFPAAQSYHANAQGLGGVYQHYWSSMDEALHSLPIFCTDRQGCRIRLAVSGDKEHIRLRVPVTLLTR
jgi:hypothetical protein